MRRSNLECADLSALCRFSVAGNSSGNVKAPASWRTPKTLLSAVCVGVLLLVAGCGSPEQKAARQQKRYAEAKALFEQTTKEHHLPSAQGQGVERDRLLNLAATGYERLLREYRDQPGWCAPALRSLGNVRATQGQLDDAVKLYARVGRDYTDNEWEVLQAWKSAADLLWEAGRQAEAQPYYQQIVTRFGGAGHPPVVQVVVRAAQRRLAEHS
jgi:tetratricopeptide (TPR) repeat protein